MNKELRQRILSSFILIAIVAIIVIKGGVIFNFFLLFCFILTIFEWHNMSKKFIYHIPGIFFLMLSYYSIYYLTNQLNDNFSYFLFILLICISTDVGGYVVGTIIKGPKLSRISPKKTYSGLLGSFIFSIIFTYFYLDNSIYASLEIFIFVITISAISQIGDLVISYFKRASKIKDTGKLIPGHGGILDRIDGMIFAFPFSVIILLTYNINIF